MPRKKINRWNIPRRLIQWVKDFYWSLCILYGCAETPDSEMGDNGDW